MTLKDTFVHDFGKFKMVLDKSDADVSKQVKEHGWYEDEKFDIDVLQRYLKAGMTFVDLGANVGFYTILGRSIVGKNGRVFAFEPFPRNARLIDASIKENSFTNVSVVQAAVSNRNGKTMLHLSPEASSEHSLLDLDFQYGQSAGSMRRKSISVNTVTLDDYFKNNVGDLNVDFIKMDIEGSEYRAVEGMQKIIERNEKIILMTEFWPNGFRKDNRDPYVFLGSLARKGFDIQFIDNIEGMVYSVSPEELRKIEKIRSKDPSKQNNVMKIWGWYTNLICTR